jgi:hypothetical protein
MPMEIFVSCVEDLATLGRVRVGLDLGMFSPLVRILFVLSARRWGMESFDFGSSLAFWPH